MLKKLLSLVFLFISFNSYSQTPEELLEKTRLNYTPEKIYIHYDKQSYIAGDTIWFKAYLMDGLLPAQRSTVLNVELINDSAKIVAHKIIPITASMAANAIVLPSNLMQGSYTITAFTRLMMNFGTASFYSKQINIYNQGNASTTNNIVLSPEVKFFPEGGNLISGMENTIAFKCSDNNGFPLTIEGKILNEVGIEKATFKSTHDGMGKFDFFPKVGEKYFAECLINGSLKKNITLPETVFNKSLMRVMKSNEKVILEINNKNVTDVENIPTYVLGVLENIVVFRIPVNKDEPILRAAIPLNTLTSGILKLTSFNNNNQPISERLLFINSGDFVVKTELTVNKFSTLARQKNDFTFLVDDTTTGSYSVAITNADNDFKNIDGVDNIVSRFLLTDNLRGKINNPAYYFESNDDIHTENLDLVMLTNGWRRYSWKEILTNKFPSMVFEDPNYISLKGIAYMPFTKDPLKETTLLFYTKTKDTTTNLFNKNTNRLGDFELSGLIFEDTATFFIQNNYGKDKRINLKPTSTNLSNLFSISKKNIPFYNFTSPTASQQLQISTLQALKNKEYKNVKLLDEIKLISSKKTERELYEKKYVTGVLGGNAARTLDFLQNPPYAGVNILDYLKAKLNGVTITGGPIDYTVNYRATRTLMGGFIPMNIFLDEFQVDASQVATMKAEDFALVKVYSTGPLAGVGGALALYTNKDRKPRPSGFSTFSQVVIEGFSVTKEFYSPNYAVSFVNNSIEDNRTTLYWNPYLTADKETKNFNFSFYNSDYAKKIKIIVQGVTRDGGLVNFEKILE